MPIAIPLILSCDHCGAQWTNQMALVTNVTGSDLKLSLKSPEDWDVRDVGAFRTLVSCPKCKTVDPLV